VPGEQLQALRRALGLLGRRRHVHDQPRGARQRTLVLEHLDQAIGVGERVGLRRGHHDQVVGRAAELQRLAAHAGGGVHDHEVGALVGDGQRAQQRLAPEVVELGERRVAGGRGHERDAGRPGEDHLVERLLARQHVAEVPARVHAEQHVEVGLRQVAVHEHDPRAAQPERHGEVRGQVALADTAAPARDDERGHAAARELRRMAGAELGRGGAALDDTHDGRTTHRARAHAASAAIAHRARTKRQ